MDTVVHHDEHADNTKKEIVRITVYLTILTLVELAIGFYMYSAALEDGFFRHFLKGVIVVLMLWKAMYIVGYFMHLKHEVRNLIMTIVVPLFLFVWFIISFLADGDSYKNLRNKYDRYHVEKASMKALPQEGHEGHEQHEEKPAHHSGPTE
jgi:cytochrome c oxidase subunit IV